MRDVRLKIVGIGGVLVAELAGRFSVPVESAV